MSIWLYEYLAVQIRWEALCWVSLLGQAHTRVFSLNIPRVLSLSILSYQRKIYLRFISLG